MNRAFYYGDLLFETMRVEEGLIKYPEKHYSRIRGSSEVLRFELPADLTYEKFCRDILKEVGRSSFFDKKADVYRVRYTLYRNAKGFYFPDKNTVGIDIRVEPLIQPLKDSLRLGIYKEQCKASGSLSNLKTGNALIYVIAGLWAKENGYDDALLQNEHGRPIEATSSNLFWLKNGIIYTPPLSEGCVAGVMREVYMEENKVTEKICSIEELQQADEVFLTNAVRGVVPASVDI